MQSQPVVLILIAFSVEFIKNGVCQNTLGLYSRRYENLDVDTILANPRLVTNYVDCLLNKRPCPPEGKDLKRILPEALRTKCGRCWPAQKEGALKVITKLYYSYPQHYNALREKWDPTGEYHRRFEEYLRDQNFNLISNEDDKDETIDLPSSSSTRIPLRVITSTIATTTIPISTTTTTTSSPQIQPETFSIRNAISPSQTQRPIRQDFNPIQLPQLPQQNIFIANRFGDETNEFDNTKAKKKPQRTPTPTTKTSFTPSTMFMKTSTTRTIQNTIIHPQYSYGTATVQIFKTQNPFLNILNRLTTKFATTAEIIAGMLRGKEASVQFQVNNNNNMPMSTDK